MIIDPGRGLDIITQLSLMPVPTPSGATTLFDATSEQLEHIKTSKGREPALAVARKTLKLMTELEDLIKEATGKGLVGNKCVWRGNIKAETAGNVENKLAIVPYIRTVSPKETTGAVPAPTAAASDWHQRGAPLSWLKYLRDTNTGKQYEAAFFRLTWLLSYLPLILIYSLQIYIALLVGYTLSHPEIVVKAAFALLDAVPNYTNFVTQRLYEQLVREVEARLR